MDCKPTNPYPHKRVRRRRRHGMGRVLPLLFAAAMVIAAVKMAASGIHDRAKLELTTPASAAIYEGDDTEAPVLSGIRDLLVYAGDAVSYLGDVTATDDRDPSPTVTVDNSAVDLSRPGQYEITYITADASGNLSRTAAMVTVLEKQAGFVDLETIFAAADEILDSILPDGATAQEAVEAIYDWARSSFRYGGHSDRIDWHQTAYTMLTEGRGDCYGYFAVTKLLFERLEIPNIDVQKVRNFEDDSDHFWSLVSVDGGESWYHFDATPRVGSGDDFCLVTDAFLDAYSDSHRGSHNRDKSLYPATPEEALP